MEYAFAADHKMYIYIFIRKILYKEKFKKKLKINRKKENQINGNEDGSTGYGKFTKALPDPPIFADRKDPSIEKRKTR